MLNYGFATLGVELTVKNNITTYLYDSFGVELQVCVSCCGGEARCLGFMGSG
jgi:hypothetical protein